MKLQLQRLQQEKETALAELQRIRSQQAQDTGLLQRTAANVQNTANAATAQNTQLATGISQQLADIANIMNTGFGKINEDLRRSFVNQNTLYNTMERRHQEYEQRFTRMEEQLARLQVQPHSPQPRNQRQHAVHLLEQAAANGPPLPPVPPPSRFIANATPSPPPQRRNQHEDWVAGKAPTPLAFDGSKDSLEGWLLQMDDFFTITTITNEQQRLAYIGLCTKGEALEWWKTNRTRHQTWEGVKNAIRVYYGNHYQADQAYTEITALRMTSTVQKYLNDLDRLNAYAKMTDHHLINIVLTGIPSRLRQAMAHYENLRATPADWRQKLLEMDVVNTEFQHKDRDSKNKDKGKKRSFEERVQLRGGEPEKRRFEGERVSYDKKQKRRKEGRCPKCGMSNHTFETCPNPYRANTPPFRTSTTSKDQPAHKKVRTDKGHFKITELGSDDEEQSGKE
jgi:hypothetical protein